MLIYGIVRHIITINPFYPYNLSCKFPKGDRCIDVVSTLGDNGPEKAWRFQLDPEAPKEVLLANTPKKERQVF
jgi:hypothetical protein